jgi:hypothetical protein
MSARTLHEIQQEELEGTDRHAWPGQCDPVPPDPGVATGPKTGKNILMPIRIKSSGASWRGEKDFQRRERILFYKDLSEISNPEVIPFCWRQQNGQAIIRINS